METGYEQNVSKVIASTYFHTDAGEIDVVNAKSPLPTVVLLSLSLSLRHLPSVAIWK